jgi:hypothetical protein
MIAVGALFATLETAGAKGDTEPVKKKTTAPAPIKHDDRDIETYEAYSPYASNREMPLPPNSPEDSIWLVEQFQKNYRQCAIMKSKPQMESIKHVTLHSTEGREE